MPIVNDDHRRRAGVASLDRRCRDSGSAFANYPLLMSDDAGQTVYHVACALELATDLLEDLYTFQVYFCSIAVDVRHGRGFHIARRAARPMLGDVGDDDARTS